MKDRSWKSIKESCEDDIICINTCNKNSYCINSKLTKSTGEKMSNTEERYWRVYRNLLCLTSIDDGNVDHEKELGDKGLEGGDYYLFNTPFYEFTI